MPNPEDSAEPSLTPGTAGSSAANDFSLGAQALDVKISGAQPLGTNSVGTQDQIAKIRHPNPKASLWDSKPWWCQPWTIVLSGLIAIAASWWLVHQVWITTLVSTAIAAWWLLFLVIVPRSYQESQP